MWAGPLAMSFSALRGGLALFERRGGGPVPQPVGFVVDRHGYLAQPQLVLVEVMRAEQQIEARLHRGAHVGLGAAAVAAVGGGQLTGVDRWSRHLRYLSR